MEQKNKNVEQKIFLSSDEFDLANKQRLSIIQKEFEAGFKFLKKYSCSVTIFGSSRFKEDNEYYKHARILGQRVVNELKYGVLTGGGPGIMEAANRGAFEAGGPSLGLTINLPVIQQTNKYLTDHIEFYYFFSRKVCLSFSAEAYIFYPGGFGTLDEFFEILTLVQTKKITFVPIILVGEKYWNNLNDLIKSKLIGDFKTVDGADLTLYTITNNHDDIMKIISSTPVRAGLKCCGEDLF